MTKKIEALREQLGELWIPAIYETKIRTQRTRAVSLPIPGRENKAEILFTLLGIELKVGRRRISCPDLATARYLRVFARLGCQTVAVPYDITRTGPLADDLEVAWQRTILLADDGTASGRRLRSAVLRSMRHSIETLGPGPQMPEFRQSTKQRNN
jgi:hypothetical protein